MAKCCLKVPKQASIGWRRASMNVARGRMAWIRPRWLKLLGSLSVKCSRQWLGLGEIAATEFGEPRGRHTTQCLRVAVAVRSERIELAGEDEDVGQLHGALDLRVAGEDLLDERRARARESDDDDGCPARIATAGALREEAAVEESADAGAARLEAPDVESRVEAP